MSPDEFNRFYFGTFEPDTRTIELQDRLQQYYNETPDHVSNKEAYVKWKEFKEWALYNGYTTDEINKAKRARRYN